LHGSRPVEVDRSGRERDLFEQTVEVGAKAHHAPNGTSALKNCT
jgi:hypothetical protein